MPDLQAKKGRKMKKCPKCLKKKPFVEFHKNNGRNDGVSVYCIPCTGIYYFETQEKRLSGKRKSYNTNPNVYRERNKTNYTKDIHKRMLYSAKKRAKTKNIPFNLDISDIVIPTTCPVLGIELCINNHASKPNSPSLDRIVPEIGYVKGNVIVVSMKANQIKTNSTLSELRAVYDFYKDKMI